MGKLIFLSQWKEAKAVKEIEDLAKELDEWIEYLGITNDFYMFDDNYSPIKIDVPDHIRKTIGVYDDK
mgnify:CR=1 FL=1